MLRWWPCAPCVDVSSAKAIFLSVTNLDWLLVSVGTWSFLGGGRVAGRGSVDSAILAQVSARVERLNVRVDQPALPACGSKNAPRACGFVSALGGGIFVDL